jgi:HK97 gp10 family phage protein
MPSVHVKGLKELQKQFETFNKEMHQELKSTMKEAVKEVAADAKQNAPEDSGEYKRSITSRVSKTGLVGWALASRRAMKDGQETSNRGYLGHLLEYGTFKNKAQPHFGPALDKVKAKFGRMLENAIRRVKGMRGQI